eukprot:tig00000448_g873.t1
MAAESAEVPEECAWAAPSDDARAAKRARRTEGQGRESADASPAISLAALERGDPEALASLLLELEQRSFSSLELEPADQQVFIDTEEAALAFFRGASREEKEAVRVLFQDSSEGKALVGYNSVRGVKELFRVRRHAPGETHPWPNAVLRERASLAFAVMDRAVAVCLAACFAALGFDLEHLLSESGDPDPPRSFAASPFDLFLYSNAPGAPPDAPNCHEHTDPGFFTASGFAYPDLERK